MRATSVCLVALALSACGDTRPSPRNDSLPPPMTGAPAPGPTRPGVLFDPVRLEPGATVGELVADSVLVRRAVVDSTYVGVARFRGQVELRGWTLRHPDPDARDVASCFEADPASATRLPRWAGDQRRPWFCFVNRVEAVRALGAPSEGVRAAVVIDRFTIHRGLSDEVNEARFVSGKTTSR